MYRVLLVPLLIAGLAGCQSSKSADSGSDSGGLLSFINVDLSDIRADIAKNINLDFDKVPLTVQMPINIAANVCGVNINILSAQATSGNNTCRAQATSAELEQQVTNEVS